MSYPINTVHRLALEAGESLILLESGSFMILVELIAIDDPLNEDTLLLQTADRVLLESSYSLLLESAGGTGLTSTPTLTFAGVVS